MIKIWKFEKAPLEFRLLETSGHKPDWLAQVPHDEDGHEFENWLLLSGGTSQIERRILPDGNALYFGRYLESRESAISTPELPASSLQG